MCIRDSTKVNITDVSAAIGSVTSQMEGKVDREFFEQVADEKVSYEDFKFVGEKKLDIEEFHEFLEKADIEALYTTLNSKSSWTEVNEMLNSKVDRETFTNALAKKLNKTDMSVMEKSIEARIEAVEESFKAKLEQVLGAQEQILKIVENENEINTKKLNRKNPQVEDIKKRLDMKVDKREIEIFTQECINNVDRIRDEVEEVVEKLNDKFNNFQSKAGNL